MGELKEFADNNSKWLKLDDGETYEGEYMGYTFMLNQSGSKVPCYQFKGKEGNEKTLQTQSTALCQFFDDDHGQGKVGGTVEITRNGTGLETRYKAKISSGVL